MLPNFVGIGAQRAATTWVYQCLREHPEVYVSDEKEVEFFTRHFQKGLGWYESHFSGASQHKAVGEITPIYLSHRYAIQRMAATIPDARLFVVLREPVSRAYSAFELHRERFQGSFRKACEERPDYLIAWGLYASHLKRVYAYYDAAQVKVFLYEDLEARPDHFLSELFGFLNVDRTFQPENLRKRFNRMMYPRTQRVVTMLHASWALEMIKKTPLGEWVRSRNVRRGEARDAHIDAQDKSWLKEQFRPDILELQDLIHRDLKMWL